jgi:hypothetical protein
LKVKSKRVAKLESELLNAVQAISELTNFHNEHWDDNKTKNGKIYLEKENLLCGQDIVLENEYSADYQNVIFENESYPNFDEILKQNNENIVDGTAKAVIDDSDSRNTNDFQNTQENNFDLNADPDLYGEKWEEHSLRFFVLYNIHQLLNILMNIKAFYKYLPIRNNPCLALLEGL